MSVGDRLRVVDRKYKGREKSVGDSSRAVNRTYKGSTKSIKN